MAPVETRNMLIVLEISEIGQGYGVYPAQAITLREPEAMSLLRSLSGQLQ